MSVKKCRCNSDVCGCYCLLWLFMVPIYAISIEVIVDFMTHFLLLMHFL